MVLTLTALSLVTPASGLLQDGPTLLCGTAETARPYCVKM